MEPEKIRDLIAATDMAEVSEKVNVPLPIARELRVQALRVLEGKCVVCMSPTKAGLCRKCEKKNIGRPILRTTRMRLLRKLDPRSTLLRKTCEECGRDFSQTVGSILKQIQQTGEFNPKTKCYRCFEMKAVSARRLENTPLKGSDELQILQVELERRKKSGGTKNRPKK